MSEQSTRRPEGYQHRREDLEGWPVGIVSYKLGDRFYCEIDNVSPGARLVRREGTSREEAEARALEKAREMLARTRKFPAGES